MKRFLKLMAIFALPVWFLDACGNRDPSYYLDDASHLFATSAISPLTFDFRDRAKPRSERFQLNDVTDFLMSDSLFTGRTEGQFFIVQRPGGNREFFATQAERDAALKRNFSTSISDLWEKPWYSGIRANIFFPYNLIYYGAVTGIIAIVCASRRGKRPTPNKGEGGKASPATS